MRVMVQSATTSPFEFLGTFPPKFRRFTESRVNADFLAAEISMVLREWDASTTIADTLTFSQTGAVDAGLEPGRTYPSDPVEAIQHLSSLLQIPQERVLAAVGVKERTFFGWKSQLRRPRPASLGRLWEAVEGLHYLAGSHPNLAAWFHSSPDAQRLFDAGDIDGLVQLELDWALRTYRPTHPAAPDFGDTPGSPARSDDDHAPPRKSFRAAAIPGVRFPPQPQDS
jgi:hypothetical protein